MEQLHDDKTASELTGYIPTLHEYRRLSRNSKMAKSPPSRRSSRVEKTRSTDISPRGANVRRAKSNSISQAPSYRQPMDVGESTIGPDFRQHTYLMPSRPLSWHPGSPQFDIGLYGFATTGDLASEPQALGGPVYSLEGPGSMTYQPSPVDNIQVGPGYMPDPETAYHYEMSPFGVPSDEQYQPEFDDFMIDPSSMVLANSYDPYPSRPQWQYQYQYESPPATQHPLSAPTQSVAPLQYPPELETDMTPKTSRNLPTAREAPQDDEILLGLGLYDPPATPPNHHMDPPRQGRGLKLEETWAPPAEAGGDVDAEGEYEDGYGSDYEDVTVVSRLPQGQRNQSVAYVNGTSTQP